MRLLPYLVVVAGFVTVVVSLAVWSVVVAGVVGGLGLLVVGVLYADL